MGRTVDEQVKDILVDDFKFSMEKANTLVQEHDYLFGIGMTIKEIAEDINESFEQN